MATPSLEQVTSWFEEYFDSVESIFCYRPKLFIIVDDRLRLEGESVDWDPPVNGPSGWFCAALKLFELRGKPKKLIWRTRPRLEDSGHIYSRFGME